MAKIRCPHCGSPATIRGGRWECGYCGDFGKLSSLSSAGQTKPQSPSVSVTVTVTCTSDEEDTPHSFSRAELEDMVRRWDFDENEWACRDLLIAAFPGAAEGWPAEKLADMCTMDVLWETGERDPETAFSMMKLLLDTAEEHLKERDAAVQLLGCDLHDLLLQDTMLSLLAEQLTEDDHLACQLFQSAYVGRPQEEILNACGRFGKKGLQQKLLELLASNPFPHDPPDLEDDEL